MIQRGPMLEAHRAFIINPVVGITYLAQPKTTLQKKPLLSGRMLEGLRGYLPGAGRGLVISLECVDSSAANPFRHSRVCVTVNLKLKNVRNTNKKI